MPSMKIELENSRFLIQDCKGQRNNIRTGPGTKEVWRALLIFTPLTVKKYQEAGTIISSFTDGYLKIQEGKEPTQYCTATKK